MIKPINCKNNMYQFSDKFLKFCEMQNPLQNLNYHKEISIFFKDKNYDLNEFSNGFDLEENKENSLDFLLNYSHFILEDDVISDDEILDFSFLKKVLKIKEGDFIKFKKNEITNVLRKQFQRVYSDNFVDNREEILKVNLQSLFDLSYDEFENLKKDEIIIALENGADPSDLNIVKIPKYHKD